MDLNCSMSVWGKWYARTLFSVLFCSTSYLSGLVIIFRGNRRLEGVLTILYWILEWIAYSFSSGYSWHRNWTQDSCNAGRFVTNFTIKEALEWALIEYFFQGTCLFDLSLKFMSIKLSVISFIILLLSVEFMLMSFHSFLILIINIFFNCPWSL